VTIVLKDRGARQRAHDAADVETKRLAAVTQADADKVAAAARLQDERTVRDRQYVLDDRQALAADLAAKVQATADTLAAKVRADQVTTAAEGRQHAADLAQLVRHDQALLSGKVETATQAADAAVDKITGLILDNTKISTEAFHEANGAKLLLADEVRRRNDIQLATERAHPGTPVQVEVMNVPLATTTTTRDE